MSNQPWPSPPTGGSMPPPPPSPAAPPYTAWATPPPPPPGGAAVATPPQSTSGLRTATIVLFWVTTGAFGLLCLALFSRQGVASDFFDSDATYSDVDDADNLVASAALLAGLGVLASAIVVSIWSLRAGRNAVARGARDVSPGLACGSWYIPFGNYVVPFIQLRRMARVHGRSRTLIGVWQGGFIVGTLCVGAINSLYDDDAASTQAFVDSLGMQGGAALIATIAYGVVAAIAPKAMRDADGA